MFATAAPASAATVAVYDSVPAPLPGNYWSLGYQAQQTSEFGDRVTLAGTNRVLESVTMGFSSFACETGTWNAACVSSPGGSYDHPITVNVYAINGTDATLPGALLATVTDTVAVPYRPSADPVNCQQDPARWFDGTTCCSGYAFVWDFDLGAGDVVLPNEVIVTVAFNTQSYGDTPTGVSNATYNALNVGLSLAAPTLGTEDNSRVFWDTLTSAYYGDAGPTGVLREALDSPDLDVVGGPLGGLIMTINASVPAPALADTGIDNQAMTAGAWIGGGVLVAGIAFFGFAAYRKRALRR